MSASVCGPQPVYDLALSPSQMATAVEGVPVWTVTNNENEFILVSQQGQGKTRQLGLFCFSQENANSLLKEVSSKKSGIEGGAKTVPVTLDKVLELSSGDNPDTADIAFRLIPDPREVHAALELAREQGRPLERFLGVPVFAADGLTIKGKTKTHIPIFLSKSDLDLAVGSVSSGGATTKAGANIEIGSLEHVLAMMKESKGDSDWKNIVLIPSVASRRALLEMGYGAPQ